MALDKFKITGAELENRKLYTVESFRGVDYSEAQLAVDKEHAVDLSNLIFKDKVNQKRIGWEQVLKIEPYTYYVKDENGYTLKTNTTNINGIWKFIGENNKTFIIAHIGKLLYRIQQIGQAYTFLDIKTTPIVVNETVNLTTYNVATELLDVKSTAFVQNKRLYVLGGNKLFVIKTTSGSITINEVEDDIDTYIPKTTTGITYKDSPSPSSTPLDDVNLMTQMRINGLISGTWFDDQISVRSTRFWDWELDSSVKCKKPTDLSKIKITINSLREVK